MECKKPGFYVAIVAFNDEATVREIGPQPTKKGAEKVEDGVNINLDHERFYTEIREVQ